MFDFLRIVRSEHVVAVCGQRRYLPVHRSLMDATTAAVVDTDVVSIPGKGAFFGAAAATRCATWYAYNCKGDR